MLLLLSHNAPVVCWCAKVLKCVLVVQWVPTYCTSFKASIVNFFVESVIKHVSIVISLNIYFSETHSVLLPARVCVFRRMSINETKNILHIVTNNRTQSPN